MSTAPTCMCAFELSLVRKEASIEVSLSRCPCVTIASVPRGIKAGQGAERVRWMGEMRDRPAGSEYPVLGRVAPLH